MSMTDPTPELEAAKARAKRALVRLHHQIPDARTELDDAQQAINEAQGEFNDTVITESHPPVPVPPAVTEEEVLDGFAAVRTQVIRLMTWCQWASAVIVALLGLIIVLVLIR